ncbi:glycerophosphodiester phosphodiesterase [Zhouia sp. PK063]|uniref:glycerophosphodiester phosphodiesterase n=1 Tax=Zhouia sp. PK063 TaxID=3373602 RepID=UPI0037B6B4E9
MKTSQLLCPIILFSALSSCNSPKASKIKFADNIVVAHRGAWKAKNFPENSIASLQQAIKLNCTGTEFDVWRTADDSLVIHHDPHFNDLEIEKSTYKDLMQFQLSNGEQLPTLSAYIKAGLTNNNHTRLVCEIKPSNINAAYGQETAQKAVTLFKELNAEDYVVYISFDYDILKKILEINPKANTQYLNGDKSPAECKADGITGIDYHFSVFQKHPEWIKEAKENNVILNAWTVNDPKVMDWLIQEKFDFVTTNEPEEVLKKLKK